MDERYTYGYGLGWNVGNEYLNDSKHLMDVYNTQIKVIDDIQSQRGRLIQSSENEITEEQIRQWYSEDYESNANLKSYESYRNDILFENKKRKDNISLELEKNSNSYFANLYYLIKIKSETRVLINKRKNELELLLSEKNIELSSINLEQRKFNLSFERFDSEFDQKKAKELSRKYDETWLEIRKIEHALKVLADMYALTEFNKEEENLMLRGLNPQQQKIYDEMMDDKLIKGYDDEISNPQQREDGDDEISDSLEKEEDKLDLTIDLSEYEIAFNEYEELLRVYNEELEQLYQLQQQYENKEIEYSVYEQYANYMQERYEFILEAYNRLIELKEKYENLIESKNKELMLKLENLEKEADNIRYWYIHEANGEIPVSPEDQAKLDQIQEKINKIKEELERRKYVLKEPISPQKPVIISEKKIVEPPIEDTEDITLDGIIYKVCGTEKFTDGQSSRYAASKIKLFNKPQKDNLGLAYKIVSIPRKVIGVIPKALMKVSGLFISRKTKQIFKDMENRANELTDQEVEKLLNEYKGAIAQGKRLPKGFNDAVRPRVNLYVGSRVSQINEDIKNNLLKINYCEKVVSAITEKLKTETDPVMIEKLEEVLGKAYENGASCVKNLISLQIKGNNLQNGNGLHSFEEELKALDTKLNYVGGRFSKKRSYDPKLWSQIADCSQKIEYSLDPKVVLESYIQREQIYKENSKEKRSLFNLGSKVTVGKLDYRPFVESLNYGNDPFIRDLITSILVVSSTASLISNITTNIKNAQTLQKYNTDLHQNVSNHNNTLTDHNNFVNEVRGGGDTIEKGITYDIKETEGAFENMAERGINDKYDWSLGGHNHSAEDLVHHTESAGLSVNNTNELLDLTNRYNSGQITHAELIRGVQEIKRHTTEIYERDLSTLSNYVEQYAKAHPEFDYTAILSALRHAKANPLDSVEMTDFLADIYEKSLNITDLQSLNVIDATISSHSLVPDILTLGATAAKATQEEFDSTRAIKPDGKKAKELREMIEGLKSLKAELTEEDLKEIESLIQR